MKQLKQKIEMKHWNEIGEKVKAHRKAQGLTQLELGKKMGASNRFISDFERGRKPCSINRLADIIAALDCDFKILMERK